MFSKHVSPGAAQTEVPPVEPYPFESKTNRQRDLYHWFSLGVLVLLAVTITWARRGWAVDDAYVTYRYAENLKTGYGFVYNTGESIVGTTAPFYALLLSIFGRVFSVVPIPTIASFISCISLIVTADLIFVLLKDEVQFPAMALVASLFIVSNQLIIDTIGMETPLVLALAISALYSFEKGNHWRAGTLLALAVMTRGDALVLAGVMSVIACLKTKKLPQRLVISFVIMLSMWSVYALYTLGTILPDTVSAKVLQGQTGLFGDTYSRALWTKFSINLIRVYPFTPLMIVSSVGLAILYRRRFAIVVLILWALLHLTAYSILNVPAYYWYYAPLIPAIAITFALGADFILNGGLMLWSRFAPRPFRLSHAILYNAGVISIGFILLMGAFQAIADRIITPRNYAGREKAYALLGEWLNANTPTDATVGAVEVGVIGFYGHRKMVDFVGLITPGVAEHIAKYDLVWAFDTYLPDYVVIHNDGWHLEKNVIKTPAFQTLYTEVHSMQSPNYQQLRVFKRNTPYAQVVQAEDMSIPVPSMRNEGYVNLFANGAVKTEIELPAAGQYAIHIIAAGSKAYDQWPKLELWIDRNLILTSYVQEDWSAYQTSVFASMGRHTLEIHFTNDDKDPNNGEDRDLRLDQTLIYRMN